MTFRSTSWFGKALTMVVLSALGMSAGGCAIHSQAPIKEVAYDFSDADFYDKDYAPSPNYAGNYEEIQVMLPAPADAVGGEEATVDLSIRQPTD